MRRKAAARMGVFISYDDLALGVYVLYAKTSLRCFHRRHMVSYIHPETERQGNEISKNLGPLYDRQILAFIVSLRVI
jgi:hypothetical protein